MIQIGEAVGAAEAEAMHDRRTERAEHRSNRGAPHATARRPPQHRDPTYDNRRS